MSPPASSPYPPQHLSPQHIDPSLHPQAPHVQLDPALALYPPQNYYPYGNQHPPHHPHQHPMHLSVPLHSPPSSASPSQTDDYVTTPPSDHLQSSSRSSQPGKRSASSASGSRKKSKLRDHNEDEDEDEEDEEMSPSADAQGQVKAKATRGSRACTVCRRLKMKCVGAEQGGPCKRCQAGNHECVFEESNRGKRSVNGSTKKHEQLARSIRKMERTLDTVLRSINQPGLTAIASGMASRSPSPSEDTAEKTQALMDTGSPSMHATSLPSLHHGNSPRLHSLPDNELNPLGLLAEASLANRRMISRAPPSNIRDNSGESGRKIGVANEVYFKPGPMTILPLRRLYIERQIQPEMLSFTSKEEVLTLFNIYFENMNILCNLLDRDFHTPSLVCSRSPFLLTTICAISSKFYSARPELHNLLTNLSRKLAFSVPEQGYKSVEIVQAYLLLALWGCGPAERFEQDKTWLLLGMGIRVATDLNLHRKTATTGEDTPEGRARDKEVLNRERTWLLCFILDRGMSAQMGKPHSIKEDSIIRNVEQWWKHPLSIRSDGAVAAYATLQRILSRSLDLLYSSTTTASGLQPDCDYYLVIKTVEAQLTAWRSEWEHTLNQDGNVDRYKGYVTIIGEFYFNYSLLVVNSFGLQNAIERSPVDTGHFFSRCYAAATRCATLVRDELGPKGFLRYAPDSIFVQCSYAILSLLKFTRPTFRSFLDDEKKTLEVVRSVADLLEDIAASPMHTPALYSSFLRALISSQADGTPPEDVNEAHYRKAGSHAAQDVSSFADHGQVNLKGDAINFGQLSNGFESSLASSNFQFNSEMGPAVDISTFPPTMAPIDQSVDVSGMLTMDSILSTGFWDSVLVPGYSNTLEGLSGGFVYGAGGSGIITPGLETPSLSGTNTPMAGTRTKALDQSNINAAFASQGTAIVHQH